MVFGPGLSMLQMAATSSSTQTPGGQMEEWLKQSAAALGRGIATGEIDPVDLTEAFLDAAERSPVTVNIYARLMPERARREALAARERARAGRRLSPLDGVPVSWKDLFDSAGTETEAGTRMLEGRVPDVDAEVLTVATGHGLVCLGKTHMSEIAFSGLGLNPVMATPPCVNDQDAVPGGSSSGAAASVAFNLAPLAIGSDTGGSVRVPSAWNDLVGFKPTHGALSLQGVVALVPSFDTVGPLSRTVEDAALAFAALGGPSIGLEGKRLQGARLLVCETVAMEDVAETPARAFDDAVQRLSRAGAEIVSRKVPFLADAFRITGPLYPPEAYANWKADIDRAGDRMFHQIHKRVTAGAAVPAHEYITAWKNLRQMRQRWLDETAGFDAVIMPTVPSLPPKVADLLSDDDYYVSENLKALRNTRIGNLMGLTALTLPTGTPSAGIMFCAPPGAEARLLRIGAAAEAALT